MKIVRLSSSIIIVLAVCCLVFAQSFEDSSVTLRSYQKARIVVDRAVAAHGGFEAIRAIDNVTLDYQGVRTMINQSRTPEDPWNKEPASGRMVVDRKNNRMYAENFTSYPGIGKFGGAWAISGNEGHHWEPSRNHHGSEVMGRMLGAENDGTWAFIPRWMPPFLVLSAADNTTNLRWIDTFEGNGRKFDAVSFIQQDRAILVAIFDQSNGLLEAFQTIRDDGVYGDVTDHIRFHEYVDIRGVKFPTKRTDYFNGQIARELSMTFSVNSRLDERLFRLPDGYTLPVGSENTPRIAKVGDGVYLDQEMGGVMIVEFEKFLVIVECPGNFWMSQSTISAVKEAIPNKPIKYVVPSHTHGDHGGGARGYYHNATTLITTPGNLSFYERLAKLKQTVRPDPYSSSANPPMIETFKKKRIISDHSQTLELHDSGPNDHAEELVFAYLPRQKIIWQSDIIFNPMTGGSINKAMPIGVDFARRLKSLGIVEVEKLIESHHSRVISGSDFRRSLQLAGFTEF